MLLNTGLRIDLADLVQYDCLELYLLVYFRMSKNIGDNIQKLFYAGQKIELFQGYSIITKNDAEKYNKCFMWEDVKKAMYSLQDVHGVIDIEKVSENVFIIQSYWKEKSPKTEITNKEYIRHRKNKYFDALAKINREYDPVIDRLRRVKSINTICTEKSLDNIMKEQRVKIIELKKEFADIVKYL